MAKLKEVNLYGRVLITGSIKTVTGLHIGKGHEGLRIGGVDNAVLRDPLTNKPYIPGSSLKGKMRSLAEKRAPGLKMEWPPRSDVQIHVCTDATAYGNCPVCPIYGVPGDQDSSAPTRLVVRDVLLTNESCEMLNDLGTDLPYTEVKYEAAIDRVTAKANPRPLERVPAGVFFGPFEMVFSIYEAKDLDRLSKVFEAMRLLEDDYLGGSGSRGSGQVCFEKLKVTAKSVEHYTRPDEELPSQEAPHLNTLLGNLDEIMAMVRAEIHVPTGEEEGHA